MASRWCCRGFSGWRIDLRGGFWQTADQVAVDTVRGPVLDWALGRVLQEWTPGSALWRGAEAGSLRHNADRAKLYFYGWFSSGMGMGDTARNSSKWSGRKAVVMELLQAALQAVDPYSAVRRALRVEGDRLEVGGRSYDLSRYRRVIVVGGGKASAPMAAAVEDALGARISNGLVNVKYGHVLRKEGRVKATRVVEVNEAGHPIPDERGLEGARRMAELLDAAGTDDLVICLISGGGSALMALPAEDVTLGDKQHLTDLLLRCGATINEMNAIRKHLSRSKGGGWARLAQPAEVISLILSDVVGSPLDVIASGPTAPDTSTFADAWWVLQKYQLVDRVAPAIRERLRRGMEGLVEETPGLEDPLFHKVNNVLIGSNEIAARAALGKAEELGFNAMLLSTYVQGEAREVGRVMVAVAKEVVHSGSPVPRPACVIAGGETTVTICGAGRGGRNQELSLAAAVEADGLEDVVIAGIATDGNDGPTDAAGAIASGTTVARARALGLDAREFLSDNNSYELFGKLGDLIIPGPTNTNVNDLTLVLVF